VFHVILHQPDIPANTGNIIRLCANTGCRLHLIEPLGFRLDRRSVRRAALDYGELANVQTHKTLAGCLEQLGAGVAGVAGTAGAATVPAVAGAAGVAAAAGAVRLFAIETGSGPLYHEARFSPGDALLFGSETRGLPEAVLAMLPAEQHLRLPMRPGNRSLNLSNAVAIAIYEAWRQNGFASCASAALARHALPAATDTPAPSTAAATATAAPSHRAGD
jgi:tRNA (cytidine/uridine-2'-O-)-methyltransferase